MARRPREFTDAEVERMVELHGKNQGTTAIAEQIGCAHTTVERILVEQGIDWRPPGTLKDREAAEYREGYRAGYCSALYHMRSYGLEAAHEYSRHVLLPWARNGNRDMPPDFPGMYAKRKNARN